MLGTQRGLGGAAPADPGAMARSHPRVLARQPSSRCQAECLFVAVEKGQAVGLSPQR